MRIEITGERSQGFCDEATYINKFMPRVRMVPGNPAKTMTGYTMTRVVGILIFALIALFLGISNGDILYYGMAIALAAAIIGALASYFNTRKAMKTLGEEESEKILDIDEDGVTEIKDGKEYHLDWDGIKCIILNKRSIVILPRNKEGAHIFLGNEYRDQLREAVRDAEHFYLIEDNTVREK